ncbi:ATP-dependent DNA helicase PIF1-like [Brachionus plicatilis]|uniref:ATP-dependent DNA helicase PIF1-like n=1 Tax=Brachionus plicatilis TaxID=10195 RepID=A0A3M7RCP7_BRAPC|nr:ATP-dependent DNA helicase PIF1-like [Brachionus plicatilis]
MIKLPPRVCCPENIVDQVFGPGQLDLDVQNRLNNALLCPTSHDALEINEIILERLQGDNQEFVSSTEILNREDELVADIDDYPIEEAYRMTPDSFPPHILNIKVGAIVINQIRFKHLATGGSSTFLKYQLTRHQTSTMNQGNRFVNTIIKRYNIIISIYLNLKDDGSSEEGGELVVVEVGFADPLLPWLASPCGSSISSSEASEMSSYPPDSTKKYLLVWSSQKNFKATQIFLKLNDISDIVRVSFMGELK